MSTLDGRSALKRLDTSLATARRALSEAIETEKQADGEIARIRQAQAAGYMALADVQLDTAEKSDERSALEAVDREVADLLARHEDYLEGLLKDLDAKADEIAALEAERAGKAAELDAAVERYETTVAEVESSLETSETYRALVETAAEAEAVTERARQKLEIARQDRTEKGAPYEADPLFMYLWHRRFRTVDYKASPLFRYLDGWVARICKYDKAYRNYDRLTDLPERIAQHVARMEEAETKAQGALEAAERHALKTAGAEALQASVDEVREALGAIDARIEGAETEHMSLVDTHAAAEAGDRGPAHEARLRLASALKSSSFPDLRLLVTQTVTAEDDAIVDQLVTLRREEMALDLRRDELADLPKQRQRTLDALERFRRKFKVQQLDSPYAMFKASALDAALDALLSGRLRPDDALRELKRKVRRRQPRAHPGFGGASRRRTSGIPEIAQDIGWEILKEMGRASRRGGSPLGGRGGFPGGFPSSRRSGRGISFPKSGGRSGPRIGGRSGGFKTGGGF